MMPRQLDLFLWADSRPSAQIIDALPRILARIDMLRDYHVPNPPKPADVIELTRRAS